MAQYNKESKKIRYIGVSVHGVGKNRELKGHYTSGKKDAAGDDQFVIWMKLPGPVVHGFADKLPRVMSKLEAVAYALKNTSRFQGRVPGLSVGEIRKFFEGELARWKTQNATASSGRKPIRSRKVITAKRRTKTKLSNVVHLRKAA